MAAVQEPEVQLAQRLASNEKAVRIKAMKKLRKYISARSLRASGRLTKLDAPTPGARSPYGRAPRALIWRKLKTDRGPAVPTR